MARAKSKVTGSPQLPAHRNQVKTGRETTMEEMMCARALKSANGPAEPPMEFLSLTEPILALCVEVDREACELRYADPFPGSQNVAMTRRDRSRVFFLALPVCSENAGRYSRTG
jgi:hypothetical protein